MIPLPIPDPFEYPRPAVHADEADCLPSRCVRESGCHYPDDCQSRGHCRLTDTE